MKKLMATLILSLTVALSAGLTACGNKSSQNGKFENFTTAEEVYAFSAASAGMIISAMSDAAPASASLQKIGAPVEAFDAKTDGAQSENPAGETETDAAATDNFAELDKYMALVESLLSDDNFGIKNTASDREKYQEKTVVSYKDLSGNTVSYEMYFNKIPVKTQTDDDETEETFNIEGIMIIDGAEYPVNGERQDETEEGETESETEFTVTLSETSVIKVEHGMEQEEGETEQEYSYSIFENNSLIERSAFSYETENDETELKMVAVKGSDRKTLYFEKETKGNGEFIKIRLNNNGVSESYKVVRTVGADGEISYEYTPINNDHDD